MASRNFILFALLLLTTFNTSAWAKKRKRPRDISQAGVEAPVVTLLPRDIGLSFEMLQFSANDTSSDESLGLLGLTYGAELLPNFSLGLSTYGAVTGRRGGFITLGANFDYRIPIVEDLKLDGSLFIGGGGGGSAPQGGGLMVRPALGLLWDDPDFGFGAGYSLVTFPSGRIDHHHPYLAISIPSDISLLFEPGPAPAGAEPIPTALHNLRLLPRLVIYRTSGKAKSDGTALGSTVKLLGFSFDYFYTKPFYGTVELLGAFQGGIAGYMSILAGAGYSWSLSEKLRLETQLRGGFAGGGQVDTGGGLVLHPSGQLSLLLDPVWIQAGGGLLLPDSGSFRVLTLHAAVGTSFNALTPKETFHTRKSGIFDQNPERLPLRLTLSSARYFVGGQTANAIANDGSIELTDIDSIGVAFDYFFTKSFFTSASTYWAYGGKSGGYASGLFGGGFSIALDRLLSWESRLRLGAGAGGRLPVGDAAMVIGDTGLQLSVSRVISLNVMGGYAKYFGGLSTPLLEAGVAFSFGIPIKRPESAAQSTHSNINLPTAPIEQRVSGIGPEIE